VVVRLINSPIVIIEQCVTFISLLTADSSSSGVDHLRLALSWNRPDIAEEQIFTGEQVFTRHVMGLE
jgi:hypothetical protein